MKKYTQFLKSLLTDKYVLYLTLMASVFNLFVYMAMKEYDAILFFVIIGFLTSYFSKNMIIIMLTGMGVTFLAVALKLYSKVREGLDNMTPQVKDSSGSTKKKKETEEDTTDENMQALTPGKFEGADDEEVGTPEKGGVADRKPKVDYASTLESAYDNLDKLLSSSAIKSMTEDTARLASKQQNLIGNINKLEPMMNKAKEMLSGLNANGGLEGIANAIVGMNKSVNGDTIAKAETE